MSQPVLYDIVESPLHPKCTALYQRLGFEVVPLTAQRKAIGQLKKQPPTWVVADFIYAFSTYYQATNISNLDVLLNSLVKYAPEAKVIVLAAKADLEHVEKLRAIHPLAAVLPYPVSEAALEEILKGDG